MNSTNEPSSDFVGSSGIDHASDDVGAHAAREAFLARFGNATARIADPHEITQIAARLLGQHLGVNRCAYADVEADQDTFNLTGDYNHEVPSIVGRYRFAQFGDECLRLMRAGEPYVVSDAQGDPRTLAAREAYALTLIRSVICVSVVKGDRFVAAMAVHQATPRVWRTDEIDLVQTVAERCWDFIERSRITRELRESEQRLRTALEAARQVAWEYDCARDSVNWSHTAASVLGISGHGAIATGSGWIAAIHPADRDIHVAAMARAMRDGSYDAQYRWTRPDSGAVVWVEATGRARLDAFGNPMGVTGLLADVTERKREQAALAFAERTSRAIIDGISDGFFVLNRNWQFTHMNREAERILSPASSRQRTSTTAARESATMTSTQRTAEAGTAALPSTSVGRAMQAVAGRSVGSAPANGSSTR
ncbi:MAG: PAS domain S-box protein [Planctomycetes bacterium]|nr:PAS domain S-box protein [Planctomycetota bacterium]